MLRVLTPSVVSFLLWFTSLVTITFRSNQVHSLSFFALFPWVCTSGRQLQPTVPEHVTKAEHPEEFYKGGRGNRGRVALLWSKARHLTGEPAPLCTVSQLHQRWQKKSVQMWWSLEYWMEEEPLGSLRPRQGHSNCNLQVLLAIISYFSILKPRSRTGTAFGKPTTRLSHRPW